MSQLIGISRSKYRVAVSDILPYERPFFFTNRFFVRFLKYYGIICRDGGLVATKNEVKGLKEILSILGGQSGTRRPAFQYSIVKSGKEKGRRLTLIHPYHQVKMVEFYDRYKTVLIDFCQRSNYSIRFPYKVAVVQRKSKGFPKYVSDDVVEARTEESLKHYFAYKYYHNINDFYDDFRFLRAEKKFVMMEKTDLEHCFDSIKPEMLSEAMFNSSMNDARGTAAYDFYHLNQAYENKPENGQLGEGIVIGPEFSRIYAEIILQRVDSDCEKLLEQEGILLNRDYVFYRYVDDGFLFFNQEIVKDRFNSIYEAGLEKFGLKRGDNEKKILFTERPFLEKLTAGKLALINLIDEKFENRLLTFKGFKKVQSGHFDTPTFLNYKSFIHSVRAIMQAYDLQYKDVMSFILGVMNKRLFELLGDFNSLYKQYCQAEYLNDISEQGLAIKHQYETDFLLFICNLSEVLFYFFSCDPRMSTSTKVVGILNQLQLFVRGKYCFSHNDWSAKFSQRMIDTFDEEITDQTRTLFLSTEMSSMGLLETLNFLELQKCMSTAVQLHPRWLSELIDNDRKDLNFYSVFQILHFIKNDKRYDSLKGFIMRWVQDKVSSLYYGQGVSDTEAVLTFFESLCCPWVSKESKKEIVEGFHQFDEESKNAILIFASKQKDMFVKWRKYNILEELQHANNTEVY